MGFPLGESHVFRWVTYDVTSTLPPRWQDCVVDVAVQRAERRVLRPRSVTSREADPNARLPVLTVTGQVVQAELPWLWVLYHGRFLELANDAAMTAVSCATSDRIKVNLNVQVGTGMRYECHVDSNPIEGLLFCTTHAPGDGGELVVANNQGAHTAEDVDRDCTVIHPVAGHLVFFDARDRAHYVRALQRDGVRVVAAMNYYTESATEAMRPADLDRHLFGDSDD